MSVLDHGTRSLCMKEYLYLSVHVTDVNIEDLIGRLFKTQNKHREPFSCTPFLKVVRYLGVLVL